MDSKWVFLFSFLVFCGGTEFPCIAQDGLEFLMQPSLSYTHGPPASASLVLGLQVCTTIPGYGILFTLFLLLTSPGMHEELHRLVLLVLIFENDLLRAALLVSALPGLLTPSFCPSLMMAS
jgi:hypothetical protein